MGVGPTQNPFTRIFRKFAFFCGFSLNALAISADFVQTRARGTPG
jgi:hypothetical protein